MTSSTSAAQYAISRFQVLSGLRVEPKNGFRICQGATRDLRTCQPDAGTGWDRVLNFPSFPLPARINGSSADDSIIAAVSSRYLGVGFGNSVTHFVCLESPEVQQALDPLRSNWTVQTTAVVQTVEREAVREGLVQFRAALNNATVTPAVRGAAEARFEAALRDSIRANTSQRADLKWVAVRLEADDPLLRGIPQLQGCRSFAQERQGSLVTGVAGLVIMGNSAQGSYVTESMFRNSAQLALNAAGAVDPKLPDAVATASASWQRSVSTRISTSVEAKTPRPTFYPFWVQFSRVRP
jgi:hypothetical protein